MSEAEKGLIKRQKRIDSLTAQIEDIQGDWRAELEKSNGSLSCEGVLEIYLEELLNQPKEA